MTGTESNAVKAVGSNSDSEDQMPDFLDDPAYMCSASRRMMMKEVIKALPGNVQHKINALKHLQKKYLSLEAKFFEEVYALECKYQALYQPLVDRRKAVIAGETELEAGEAEWEDESDDEKEMDAEVTKRFERMALNYKNQHSKVIKESKGIPAFWLTVFKNTQTMADMIQPHDEPLLEHLTNVNIVYKTDPMSYVLEFHFSPNTYFKDAVLTKTYFMRCQVDEEEPFSFEGELIEDYCYEKSTFVASFRSNIGEIHMRNLYKLTVVLSQLVSLLSNSKFPLSLMIVSTL